MEALAFMRMFKPMDDREQTLIHSTLRDALNDPGAPVRAAALRVLASAGDPVAVDLLGRHLNDDGARVLDLASTVHLLANAVDTESLAQIRSLLQHEDNAARLAAISHLGSDPVSWVPLRAILKDPEESYEIRSAAAGSLLYHDKEFAETALSLVEDEATPNRLKSRLRRALKKHSSELNPTGLSREQLDDIRAELKD